VEVKNAGWQDRVHFFAVSAQVMRRILKFSPQSVMRDWKLAKAWLLRELSRQHAGG